MGSDRTQIAFERGRSRMVALSGHGCRVHEVEIERGRVVMLDGEHLFSGPPPLGCGLTLGAPSFTAATAEVCALLGDLVGSGRAQLHYSASITQRVTKGGAAEGPVRELAVWAVTGWIAIAGSRRLPIGWSGRGDGLAWLRTHATGELRSQMVASVAAVPTDPGSFPVVLSAPAAAVLVHEVGHFAEAPATGGVERVGCQIASPLLEIVDDPLSDGPGHYQHDDENIRVLGQTPVVTAGVLVAQLHSNASAHGAGTLSTGNGRAASAWDSPIPRMSNLLCRPGPDSEAQLVARIEDGLYIHRLADGISSGGRIEARVVLAERIRGGVRTQEYLRGGRIDEPVTVMRRVSGVADTPVFNVNAMCGRAGQLLFDVGTSAPALQLSALRIIA